MARIPRAALIVSLLSLATAGRCLAAEPAERELALKAAGALYQGIETVTLPNGLRIYLKPIPGSPVVTTMVGYQVGSADEDKDFTGLAHYLEHLMFKGTVKLRPGDIDRLTLRNGGQNNAYTSEDMTVYFFDFAGDRWDAALAVEADRMRNVQIDTEHEFEQEKGAVIEELQRNEDTPWDLEHKAILPLMFGKQHPYGHPVIGLRQHVRAATAKVIKEYYDRWYHPNNAVIVVCGGFDVNEAKAKIKRLFGEIPAGKLPKRTSGAIAGRKTPARHEMASKFELPRMLAGYNTIPRGHADYAAIQVLDAILSGGKTGRLYKRLIEKEEMASSVGTFYDCGRHAGWLAVQVELVKGKDRAAAEKIVLEEFEKVRNAPVTAEELARVKQMLLTAEVFGKEGVHALADSIMQSVLKGDLKSLQEELPKAMAVTAADVQRVAKKYLDPEQRVVVWSIPDDKKAAAGAAPERAPSSDSAPPSKPRPAQRANRDEKPLPLEAGRAPSLSDAKKVVLPNGLTLMLVENHRLPIVQATAHVRYIALREPAEKSGLASLTGSLLDEGTSQHTGPQISELIESAGGTLAMTETGGSVGVLAPKRSLGLSLLIECLTDAKFPEQVFQREKARQLSEIADQEQQPDKRATREFRALIYGEHPFSRGSLGKTKTVEPLNRADCEKFFRTAFVPDDTIIAIVGDFETAAVVKELTELTKTWKAAGLKRPKTPDVEPPPKQVQKIISLPEAAQLHFFLGHVGIRRSNPDYYKLLVMDYVLGTGPGFTDRLSSRLRDREGLAYTVTGNISLGAAEEPGPFACYIGTDSANFGKVKGMMLEELNRIRSEPATRQEVDDAKQYLLGTLPFQFATNGNIAAQLINVERHELGFGFFDDYRKAVGAVTPADVQAVAKKYLHPDRAVIVAAGAIDDKGEPLEEEK